jgi:hypothetical protein
MEIGLAILAGALCKIYDDFSDSKLVENALVLECLKGLQWVSLCLLSFQDFNFSFMNYTMNVLNAISNPLEWSPAYEHSLLLIYPIFLVLSFRTIQYPNIYDLFFLANFWVAMFAEPYIISEDYSHRKLVMRSIFAVSMLISFMIPISTPTQKIVGYCLGYLLASCAYQVYRLFGA